MANYLRPMKHCAPLPPKKNKKIKVVNYKYQINNIRSSIDPFMITALLHSSGTFVSGYNTLSRKMTS
jgi:hypothetical protein